MLQMSFMCRFLCNSMVTFLERTALLGCWFATGFLPFSSVFFSVFPLGRRCSGLLHIIPCLCFPTDDSIQSFLLPIALIVITLFPCIFFAFPLCSQIVHFFQPCAYVPTDRVCSSLLAFTVSCLGKKVFVSTDRLLALCSFPGDSSTPSWANSRGLGI